MWLELRAVVAGLRNPHLKGLLEAVLDDEEIARRYRVAPAAKQIHHAFLGGLIEHVLSVCGLAKSTAAHYPNIDYDLLVTGAILHDIGKIYELNYERGFSIPTKGSDRSHISIAMRMVGDKLRGSDFPPRGALVEHMIRAITASWSSAPRCRNFERAAALPGRPIRRWKPCAR
jgi:3'-5' exoribonuclease